MATNGKRWKAAIGGVIAILLLICIWIACVFKVLNAVNAGEEPRSRQIERSK